MAQIPAGTHKISSQPLIEDVLSLLDWPVAIVADGEHIIAQNAQWIDATGCQPANNGKLSLAESLRNFTPTADLLETLSTHSMSVGTVTISHADKATARKQPDHQYVLRWRQLPSPTDRKPNVVLILQENPSNERREEVPGSRQALINRLFIRQTLTEEIERRKFGRALHDVVIQDLAQIRKSILAQSTPGSDNIALLAQIDQVITDARLLMFELSPPVLEDLGLAPAIEWLAEFVSNRHKVKISTALDIDETQISKDARIILFRAVRELATNAAKYAHESEIIISCVSNKRAVRIIVVDSGPGFDTTVLHKNTECMKGFGLLSVEQQIRGIGGSFDLISTVESGTRVTITLPFHHKQ